MKKKLITAIAILGLIACAKSEDKKNPMEPVQEKTDSKALQDAKKAAQGIDGDKTSANPTVKDGTQGAANANATSNANGAKTGDPTPIPTQQKPNGNTAGSAEGDKAANPQAAKDGAGDANAANSASATTGTAGQGGAQGSNETSYDGEILKLIVPHEKNFGWIKIEGDDAKQLFESLQLKSVTLAGNAKWNPARVKDGVNISCFEQAQKATPKANEYTCSLYLDYKEGRVNAIGKEILEDKAGPELKENYVGKYVYMSAKGAKKFAAIRIEGADAKRLFETLAVEGKKSDKEIEKYLPGTNKEGTDISCMEKPLKATPEKLDYTCLTYLSIDKGATLKAK